MMTRFQQEISGALGDYWQKSATQEVENAVKEANEKAIVEADGAIKWKNNGNYLMDDFCEKLEYAGYSFSREATARARDLQYEKIFEEYRRNYQEPTEEELFEMRAAFGEGTKVVDVITGREIQL